MIFERAPMVTGPVIVTPGPMCTSSSIVGAPLAPAESVAVASVTC